MGIEAEPLLDGHDAEQNLGLKDVQHHLSRKQNSRRWSWLMSALTHVLVVLVVLVAINFVPHARTVLILGERPQPKLYCTYIYFMLYLYLGIMCANKRKPPSRPPSSIPWTRRRGTTGATSSTSDGPVTIRSGRGTGSSTVCIELFFYSQKGTQN